MYLLQKWMLFIKISVKRLVLDPINFTKSNKPLGDRNKNKKNNIL